MDMATNGTKEAEVRHRPGEEANILGKLRNGLKERSLSLWARMGMFDGIVIQTLI